MWIVKPALGLLMEKACSLSLQNYLNIFNLISRNTTVIQTSGLVVGNSESFEVAIILLAFWEKTAEPETAAEAAKGIRNI